MVRSETVENRPVVLQKGHVGPVFGGLLGGCVGGWVGGCVPVPKMSDVEGSLETMLVRYGRPQFSSIV